MNKETNTLDWTYTDELLPGTCIQRLPSEPARADEAFSLAEDHLRKMWFSPICPQAPSHLTTVYPVSSSTRNKTRVSEDLFDSPTTSEPKIKVEQQIGQVLEENGKILNEMLGMNKMMVSLMDDIRGIRQNHNRTADQVEKIANETTALRRVVYNTSEETNTRIKRLEDRIGLSRSNTSNDVPAETN